MIADIGTRRGSTLNDVDGSSRWFYGDPWMKLKVSEMPIFNISEVKMSRSEEAQSSMEIRHLEIHHSEKSNPLSKIMNEVNERLIFSDYLISQVKYRYQKVVRIMGFVIKFCETLKSRIKNSFNHSTSLTELRSSKSYTFLTEEEIESSKKYFFIKSSQEVKKFIP